MKLIDKDKALFVLKSNSWNIDEWDKPIELRQAGLLANDMDYRRISEIDTVEAIPIQFLKDWSEQNEYDETIPRTIPLVLSDWEDWRKKNEKV